jgi:hypothetical protein
MNESLFTQASDVWSFGIVLVELVQDGMQPYGPWMTAVVRMKVTDGFKHSQPESCSDELYAVMMSCWSTDSKERPHFSQVVQMLNSCLVASQSDLTDVTRPLPSKKHADAIGPHASPYATCTKTATPYTGKEVSPFAAHASAATSHSFGGCGDGRGGGGAQGEKTSGCEGEGEMRKGHKPSTLTSHVNDEINLSCPGIATPFEQPESSPSSSAAQLLLKREIRETRFESGPADSLPRGRAAANGFVRNPKFDGQVSNFEQSCLVSGAEATSTTPTNETPETLCTETEL